jgi:hypothetical protein
VRENYVLLIKCSLNKNNSFQFHKLQAGVHGVLKHIAKDQIFPPKTTDVNFVFSHVYMPPKFPLLQINREKLRSKQESGAGDWDYPSYFRKPNDLVLTFKDLAGKSIEDDLKRELLTLASQAREASKRGSKKIENFVILPTHLMDTLEDCSNGTFFFKSVYR